MKGLGLIVWGLGFFYSFCLGSWVFPIGFVWCLGFSIGLHLGRGCMGQEIQRRQRPER